MCHLADVGGFSARYHPFYEQYLVREGESIALIYQTVLPLGRLCAMKLSTSVKILIDIHRLDNILRWLDLLPLASTVWLCSLSPRQAG
jgi:fumarate reductase subunit C